MLVVAFKKKRENLRRDTADRRTNKRVKRIDCWEW
jgi:hypothetical protein